MRYHDLGAFYRVTVSAAEVEAFSRRWPGSGLSGRYAFTFDHRSGDLIDVDGAEYDGPDLLALSHDAQAYGAWKRLGVRR